MPATLELDIPDAFHQAKRATMLYSVLLLVISIATLAQPEIALGTLDGVKLPVGLTKVLLWFGAVYYCYQFVAEFYGVRLRNSQHLAGVGGDIGRRFDVQRKGIEASAEKFHAAIDKLNEVIHLQARNWERREADLEMHRNNITQQATNTIVEIRTLIDDATQRQPTADFSESMKVIFDRQAASIADAHQRATVDLALATQLLEQIVEGDVVAQRKNFAEAQMQIGAAYGAYLKAHARFTRWQRAHLFGWELGGPAVLFLIATLFAAEPVMGWHFMTDAAHQMAARLDPPL